MLRKRHLLGYWTINAPLIQIKVYHFKRQIYVLLLGVVFLYFYCFLHSPLDVYHFFIFLEFSSFNLSETEDVFDMELKEV